MSGAVAGVAIVVWRRGRGGEREWLLLHRSAFAPDFSGEWAWGPPGGGREEDDVETAARRELREETGLELELRRTRCGDELSEVFAAEAPADAAVRLSGEHDAHEWLPLGDACRRCLPARVAAQLRCVDALVR